MKGAYRITERYVNGEPITAETAAQVHDAVNRVYGWMIGQTRRSNGQASAAAPRKTA